MNDLTQARKLIKECLSTQNPHLDLGNCGINVNNNNVIKETSLEVIPKTGEE